MSRFNIALVIVCLGAVIWMWNSCQLSNYELNVIGKPKSLTRRVPTQDKHDDEVEDENRMSEQTLRSQEKELQDREDDEGLDNDEIMNKDKNLPYQSIEVLVNGDRKIEGRFEKDEVYIPFSFIKNYFEIDGRLVDDSFGKKFEWRHTTYDYFTPSTPTYNPRGSFMWFVNYNVEGRSRVKCISGVDEVPMSTQWGREGYYYPIQIAQYGLSHYSRVMEIGGKDKNPKVVDDCERPGNQEWSANGKDSSIKNVFNQERSSRVMEFETGG